MKTFINTLVMMCGLLVFSVSFAGSMSGKETVAQIAAGNKDFSTLVTALKKVDLIPALSGKGPFTVFAPTNKAFSNLPKGALEKLLENPKKLKAVLLYHVLSGDVKSSDIKSGKVKTLQGETLRLKVKNGKVFVNDAQVTGADINASNGVIHVIDKVLIPKQ